MKQVFRRAAATAAVLLGVLGTGLGCTDQETGLFIQGNVARVAPSCVARAEGTTLLLGVGVLDVGLRLDYEASLLVGSQLAPRADKENLRAETMITTITGAEVQLFTDTGELSTEFTVPASGVIRPDASEDPGFGIINATLIPAAEGAALFAELTLRSEVRTRVAQVRVFGETLGGLEVESADMSYVIRVCKGCLVSFPPAALQGAACSRGQDQNPEVPCRIGQDSNVDCRLCAGYSDFCRTTEEVL